MSMTSEREDRQELKVERRTDKNQEMTALHCFVNIQKAANYNKVSSPSNVYISAFALILDLFDTTKIKHTSVLHN